MAGVHRDTLLRWLRTGSVSEPARDRRGWRVFTASEAAAIKAFATGDRLPLPLKTPMHYLGSRLSTGTLLRPRRTT